ncbi:hypothetical protein R2B67_14585 [Streptomyces cyaneofuscatus]|nr:hypothetical protein [Streptomyces cyaneofuscatus]WOP09718.1 hypothetical protein R2B67_14585 [Streptomyces cyaneofuscatus]
MTGTTGDEQTESTEQGSVPAEDPILADLIWLQETREDRLAKARHLR